MDDRPGHPLVDSVIAGKIAAAAAVAVAVAVVADLLAAAHNAEDADLVAADVPAVPGTTAALSGNGSSSVAHLDDRAHCHVALPLGNAVAVAAAAAAVLVIES